METHAHHLHNAPGKSFWHFFFEFFMLFLAVFCGFLAENQRERIEENQLEKQYMGTLLEDLKIDTAKLSRLKLFANKVIGRRDSVIKYLRPPVNDKNLPQYIRESQYMLTLSGYNYNDRTVEQLRSSGNYRLIRKTNVTDSLISYDTYMRGTFTKNYNAVYDHRHALMGMLSDIYDIALVQDVDKDHNVIIDSLKKDGLYPLHLFTNDPKILFHYYNECLLQANLNMDFKNWINRMQAKASNLIALIQKEYHLE